MSRPSNPGAWIPWDIATATVSLRLTPASRWQVFMAVLLTSARYGGRDARLSTADISEVTGLSQRTVKSSVRDLCAAGLLRRTARYRRLAVLLTRPPTDEVELLPPEAAGSGGDIRRLGNHGG